MPSSIAYLLRGFLLLITLIAASSGTYLPWKYCTSPANISSSGIVMSVEARYSYMSRQTGFNLQINETNTFLVKGKLVDWTIKFMPRISSRALSPYDSSSSGFIVAIISGIEVRFEGPPCTNPCKSVGCPTTAGSTYEYKLDNVVFDRELPEWSLLVKWSLVDELNREVLCVLVPVKLANA